MRERETKLSVEPAFHLPDLDDAIPGLRADPGAVRRSRTTFHDTEDLRLARWGATLRYRTGEGWTVKLPSEGGGRTLDRDELTFAGPATAVPEDARELLSAYTRGSPVGPVARISTARTAVRLLDADGVMQAEIVDDRVSVMDGRRVADRFRELEVELAPDAPKALLRAVVGVLVRAGAKRAEPVPKVVRALGTRAAAPHDLAAPSPKGDGSTASVVRASVAAAAERLVRSDPGVRIGADPEAVHQARVAARRLRSDLRTFATVIDAAWADPIRRELRWVGRQLGGVRDADVLLARLRANGVGLGESLGLEQVLGVLEASRTKARERLLRALRSERYTALLEHLTRAVRDPSAMGIAPGPAREALEPVVLDDWADLQAFVEGLPPDPADDQLHEVRIRVKRARYAAEAMADVGGKRMKGFARAAAALQEHLGEHQDAAVARAWLDARRAKLGREGAFAAGQLWGMESSAVAAARAGWRSRWRKLAKAAPG